MQFPRRTFLLATGAAAVSVVAPAARAQAYPSRQLRWIIGFPPGGGADSVARVLGPWLSERLGQSVIIENRAGASSIIAAQAVANSPPDGYTLFYYGLSTIIAANLMANPPVDMKRDLTPVVGIVDYPMVLVAHPSVPATTIPELVAYAKANPGKVSMASFGLGSASHLAGELLKLMAGIDMVHVPYRGGAPMMIDLVGGQVHVGFDVMVTSVPHIRTGALRALAVAGAKRFELLPDVPTIAESIPGYEARTWAGMAVPRDTPPEIIARLHREVSAGLAEPSISARLKDLGTIPMSLTTQEFAAYAAAETEKWAGVVRVAGIKSQ